MPIVLPHNTACQFPHIQISEQSVLTVGEGQRPSIRLKPLPVSNPDKIAVLDDQAAELYNEICYYFEPQDPYTRLPFHLQQEIDQRRWCGAIAQLQVKGLIQVEIGG